MEWIEEVRQIADQCWCDPETKEKEMDPVLAEAVAKCIAIWMEIAAQNERNTSYYRGLVQRIGETIGKESFVHDDGGISRDVLCAKVPELVEELIKRTSAKDDEAITECAHSYQDMPVCVHCGHINS